MEIMMSASVRQGILILVLTFLLAGFTCNRGKVDATVGEAVTPEGQGLYDHGELQDLDESFQELEESPDSFPQDLLPDDLDDFDPYLDADELYERLQKVPPPLLEDE